MDPDAFGVTGASMADAGTTQRSGRRDLTQGRIGPTLLAFALPTLGSSVLQSLNGSVNAIWVGNFLGEDALAATTNGNLVMFLLMAFVFGFGMAATILIGQAFGRRDIEAGRRVMGTSIGTFVALVTGISLLGWILAPQLLHLLATPGDASRARARLFARDLRRHAADADADHADDGAARRRRFADAAMFHADRRGARRRAQPGLHSRARPGAAPRHQPARRWRRPSPPTSAWRDDRLYLCARPAAAAARSPSCATCCRTARCSRSSWSRASRSGCR